MVSFSPRQANRKIGHQGVGSRKGGISPTFIFVGLFGVIVVIYVCVVAWFSLHSSSPLHQTKKAQRLIDEIGALKNDIKVKTDNKIGEENIDLKGVEELKEKLKDNPRNPIVRNFKPKPKGEGIKPEALLKDSDINKDQEPDEEAEQHPDPAHIMTAYVEPINFDDWKVKPLPVRATATKDQLQEITFEKVNSCKRLPERWPADEYPDQDTFLPWIHDGMSFVQK